MTKYGIECVCFGNNHRSVTAHAILSDYVSKKNLPISVFSSGMGVSIVNATLDGDMNAWSDRPVFVALVRANIDPNLSEIDAIAKAVEVERMNRDAALRNKGYISPKNTHDQTVARDDVQLVLTATPGLAEKVVNLYTGLPVVPVVADISAYSGVSFPKGRKEDIINPMFSVQYVDAIEIAAPRIISRFLDEIAK